MPNIVFDNFNAGQPEDTWNADKNFFKEAVHLDNYNLPGRIRPYRSWVEITGGNEIQNLLFASDGNLYGLGADGSNYAEIFEQTTYNGNWTTPSNNNASAGLVRYNMMFEHQGYIYVWDNVRSIGRFKLDGTAFTTNWFSVPTSVTNSTGATIPLSSFGESLGYRYDLNDQAYFAYSNALFGINNSTDTPVLLLLLPQEYLIKDMDNWNDYIAVGCQHKEKYNGSKVFFWNTLSADPSFSSNISEGRLEILKNVGGELVAIMEFGASTSVRGTSIIASTYDGAQFKERRRVTVSLDREVLTIREPASLVKNSQLYFGAKIGSDAFIYRFGINGNAYGMTKDRYVMNDNGDASDIFAIEVNGDTFFNSVNASSTTETHRTNDVKDYTMTSKPVYTTIRIPAGKNGEKGKLNYIGVHTVPPIDEDSFTPSDQVITISYRADKDAAFSPLGEHDAEEQDYTKLAQSGGTFEFPDKWKTIELKAEVEGLAQLHRLEVDWTNVPSDVG